MNSAGSPNKNVSSRIRYTNATWPGIISTISPFSSFPIKKTASPTGIAATDEDESPSSPPIPAIPLDERSPTPESTEGTGTAIA
jgi:hypothetical protein